MRRRHQVSRSAVEMIKKFEGFRPRAARTPAGRWTVGYGHTQSTREDTIVSERDAQALLLYDLMHVTHEVNECVFAPLSQNQFDALVSFVYNIGSDNFQDSAVLRHLNAGEPLRAAMSMDAWRKAIFRGESVVIDSLVRRRAIERSLFLTPQSGWVPAPSGLLEPRIDADADRVVPMSQPLDVTADDDANLILNSGHAHEALPLASQDAGKDGMSDPGPFPASELSSATNVETLEATDPATDLAPPEILDAEFVEDPTLVSEDSEIRTFPLADEHHLSSEDSAFADALPEPVPELELPPRATASQATSFDEDKREASTESPGPVFGPVQLPEPPVDTSGRTWQLLILTSGGLLVFILGLLNGLNSWAGEGNALWAWLAAGMGAIAMATGTYWLLRQISGVLDEPGHP